MVSGELYLIVQNYKWVCMDSTLTRTLTPEILQGVPITYHTHLYHEDGTAFTSQDLADKYWYMTMYITDALGNTKCVLASSEYRVEGSDLYLQFTYMNTTELVEGFENDGDPQDTLTCSVQVDYDFNGDSSDSGELGQCLGFGRFKAKLIHRYKCDGDSVNPVTPPGGGTTDYNALRNKPTINDVPLEGNKTGAELGLLDAPVNEGSDGQIIVKQGSGNIWRDFLQKIPMPDLTFSPENSTIYTYTPEAGDVIHFTGNTPADFVLAVTVPDPAVSFSIADVEWEATGIPDFTHPGDTVLVRVLFDGTVYKAATYKDYSEYVRKEDVVDGLNFTVHTESGVLANFIKAQTPYDTQGITIGNPVGGVGGVPVYFTENVYVDNYILNVQNSCMYYNGKQLDEYFVQADWEESDSEALSYIQNKPDIPEPVPQVQSNWDESDSSDAAYIQNKPIVPQSASDIGAIPDTGLPVVTLEDAATVAIPGSGKTYVLEVSQATSISFPATSSGGYFWLYIRMGATAYTVTFPSGIEWSDGSPDLTGTNSLYRLTFLYDVPTQKWLGSEFWPAEQENA